MTTRSTMTVEPGDERALAAQQLGLPDLQIRHVTEQLHMRAGTDDEGTFDGYACVWDVRDTYGTSFRRGCFTAGGLDQLPYALLWMHMPWEPRGIFTGQEDDHGLRIFGRWDETGDGQDARTMARSGSAPGLSVGFVPIGTDPDDQSVFTVCKLVETSQITARMASVPGAELVGVRTDTAAAEARARAAQLAVARLRVSVPR